MGALRLSKTKIFWKTYYAELKQLHPCLKCCTLTVFVIVPKIMHWNCFIASFKLMKSNCSTCCYSNYAASGNYPPPSSKYSLDLRCLIGELFRRNPRLVWCFACFCTFSYEATLACSYVNVACDLSSFNRMNMKEGIYDKYQNHTYEISLFVFDAFLIHSTLRKLINCTTARLFYLVVYDCQDWENIVSGNSTLFWTAILTIIYSTESSTGINILWE